MDFWLVHGLLGCSALLLVFPLGIASLWFKKMRWSMPHWAIQVCGMLILALTTGLGLLRSRSMHHNHQWLGLAVLVIVLIQIPLGFTTWGNRVYKQSVSVAHAIFGFSILVLGWLAILTGFRLRSLASAPFILVGLLSVTEIFALIMASFFLRWRRRIVTKPAPEASEIERLAPNLYTLAEHNPEDSPTRDGAPYLDKTYSRRSSGSTVQGLAAA